MVLRPCLYTTHSVCIRHFHDSQFPYILWPTMFNDISTVMQLYGVNLKHRFLILFEHRLYNNRKFIMIGLQEK